MILQRIRCGVQAVSFIRMLQSMACSPKTKFHTFEFSVATAIPMSPDEKHVLILSDLKIWKYHVVAERGQGLASRTNVAITSLRLTSDGQFLETNRGMIRLQSDTDASDNLQFNSVWGQGLAFLGEE